MADQGKQQPTNERIVRLLEDLKRELAESNRRQDQMARDIARLTAQR
jgi:hypothetical protein